MRYCGVAKNDTWLQNRVAALNPKRLLVLGLGRVQRSWMVG